MGKIISAYGSFTAQNIKDRADIPAQADMTVSGSNVDCINIPLSLVHNTLQSSLLTVYGLCTTPRVNKWSNFSPKEWYVDANHYLQNRAKTPYYLGNFAGYNHGAVQARVLYDYSTKNAQITPVSNTFSVQVALNSGEINWTAINGGSNISKVCVKVYDSLGQLKTTKSVDISTFMKDGDQIPCIITDSITSTDTTDKTWYVMVYFGSLVEELIAYYPEPVGTSPVVYHYSFPVKYLDTPTIGVSIDYTTFPSFPTMQITTASGTTHFVDVAAKRVDVRCDIKPIPPFQDCGGNGNFPRFANSPLVYNADVKLVKGSTGQEYMFYDVIAGNNTCVNYANVGTNDDPPYQRIWFSYTFGSGYDLQYGDHIFVYLKRKNSNFQYGYCNGSTPVYVP